MIIVDIKKAKRDFVQLLSSVLDYEEEVFILSNKGTVVCLSEEHYRGILETLHLSQNNKYKKTLLEGLKMSLDQTISEDSIKW